MAASTVVTGGTRVGMMMPRADCPGRERQHRAQHLAVAQVNVPVVRTPDRDAVDCFPAGSRGGIEKRIQIHGSASRSNSYSAADGNTAITESRKLLPTRANRTFGSGYQPPVQVPSSN